MMQKEKKCIFLNFKESQNSFDMCKGTENFFATQQRLRLDRERVRIELTTIFSHQNVILAFLRNICVSLPNKSVCSFFSLCLAINRESISYLNSL